MPDPAKEWNIQKEKTFTILPNKYMTANMMTIEVPIQFLTQKNRVQSHINDLPSHAHLFVQGNWSAACQCSFKEAF